MAYGLGLNGTLAMGVNSLTTQRIAIEVTGNNLSNMSTPGASKQTANITEDIGVNVGVGEEGSGSYVASITSARSALMDAQVVKQSSLGSYYDKLQGLTTSAENDLGETVSSTSSSDTNSATGITAGMDNFWGAWQSLASDPSSVIERNNVLSNAGDLADTINATYSGLTDSKSSMIQEAQANTDKLNTLSSEIASLNQQIAATEIQTQSTANDLRDKRQYLVEQMSQLTDITVTNNPTNSAMLNISIGGDASNRLLVNGINGAGAGTSYRLNAVATNPVTGNAEAANSYNVATNSALTYTLTTGSATAPNYAATTNPPNPGLGIPAADLLTTTNQQEGELGAEYYTVNTVLGNGLVANDTTLMGRLRTLANNITSQVNAIQNSATAWDANGNNNAGNFFDTVPTPPNLIQVSATMTQDKIAAASGATYPGTLDGTNATALANLSTSVSLGEYQRQTVSNIGTTVSQTTSHQTAQDLIVTQVTKQRDSVSGISEDEEVANLTTFQNAYSASAKLVTTLDEMYQTVINMKST